MSAPPQLHPGAPGYVAPIEPRAPKPSPWNAPAYGMLAIFLAALSALVYPQWRARQVEHRVNPLVGELAQRPATARCPRYITSIFTNVGSVRMDENGIPANHTDLTGPICDGLRRLYSPAGRAELQCLVTDGRCSPTALRSVIALSTVAHESMHLRGQLDEAGAECDSIAAGQRSGELAGLSPDQGRMIAYLHLMALNPNTPSQYAVSPSTCPAAADLTTNPPGTEPARQLLVISAEQAWITLGDD